jgi:hypothetical protein
MPTRRLLLLTLLTAHLIACDKKEAAPQADSPPQAETPAAVEPAGGRPPAPPADEAHAPIPEEHVRALLDAWLKAQNEGDLAAYSALYAERFTGIRRTRDQSVSLDRDGWLKDRARMFNRPMKVNADAIIIRATHHNATIRFEQSWQSGTFRDVGPKTMTIIPQAGSLKIAREELLSSTSASPEDKAKPLSEAHYLPIRRREAHTAIVLDQDIAPDKRPAIDKMRLLKRGYVAAATLTQQPTPQTFELFGPLGKVCEVKSKEYALIADVIPHFGQVEGWEGYEDHPAASEETVAQGLFEMASDAGTHRVALIDGAACEGAVWARVKSVAPATVFSAIDAEQFKPRARDNFKKLKSWKKLQETYKSEQDEHTETRPASWDEHESHDHIAAWQAPDSKTVYVFYRLTAGHGCGDFRGELWAVWRVLGGDAWTLVSDDKISEYDRLYTPSAAADLDNDGLPEIMAHDTLIQQVGATWRVTRYLDIPYFDCPC